MPPLTRLETDKLIAGMRIIARGNVPGKRGRGSYREIVETARRVLIELEIDWSLPGRMG